MQEYKTQILQVKWVCDREERGSCVQLKGFLPSAVLQSSSSGAEETTRETTEETLAGHPEQAGRRQRSKERERETSLMNTQSLKPSLDLNLCWLSIRCVLKLIHDVGFEVYLWDHGCVRKVLGHLRAVSVRIVWRWSCGGSAPDGWFSAECFLRTTESPGIAHRWEFTCVLLMNESLRFQTLSQSNLQ